MKFSIPFVVALVTVSIFLPYLWFIFIEKKEAIKRKNYFKDILKNQNLKLTQEETWNNNFIGLDELQKKIIFMKLETGSIPVIIDLNDIKVCHIIKTEKEYKKDKKPLKTLEKVDLELIYFSKNPYLILNFFDTNEEFSENLEMARAEKWHLLITNNILKKDNYKRAA